MIPRYMGQGADNDSIFIAAEFLSKVKAVSKRVCLDLFDYSYWKNESELLFVKIGENLNISFDELSERPWIQSLSYKVGLKDSQIKKILFLTRKIWVQNAGPFLAFTGFTFMAGQMGGRGIENWQKGSKKRGTLQMIGSLFFSCIATSILWGSPIVQIPFKAL